MEGPTQTKGIVRSLDTACGNGIVTPPQRLRKGPHSISINDQWRIGFRFVDGDAYDVEVCDYH
jgi:hypothetical protein